MTGIMHRSGDQPGEEDYQMMSLDFSDAERAGHRRRWPRSVAAATSPPTGRRPSPIARWPALQVSCERGIAFVDLPSTLVWFDEAGRHQESLESERPVGEQFSRSSTARSPAWSARRPTWKTPIGRCASSSRPGGPRRKGGEWGCKLGLQPQVTLPHNMYSAGHLRLCPSGPQARPFFQPWARPGDGVAEPRISGSTGQPLVVAPRCCREFRDPDYS